MPRAEPPSVRVDAAAVGAGSLLYLCGCVWLGSHFYSGVVAALLVQHALWPGAAAGTCARPGLRGAVFHRRGARVQAAVGAPGSGSFGGSDCVERMDHAARAAAGICGGY